MKYLNAFTVVIYSTFFKNAGIKDEEINIVECNARTWYVNDTRRRSLYRTDKTE